MFKTTLIAALLVLAAPHQPAFAQDAATPAATPEASTSVPSPWLAGTLSLGTPLVLGAVSMRAFGLGAPLGFGAGHWYAGDPVRGALVSLGGFGAAYAGYSWGLSSGGGRYPGGGSLTIAVLTAWGVSLAYGLWAGYDAHHTAERLKPSDAE